MIFKGFEMINFLNTTNTTYSLEELIQEASDRLNNLIKKLLIDKNRLKIDLLLVYEKSELQPEEINWLNKESYEETQRIISIIDEIRTPTETKDKLTSSKLAENLELKISELLDKMVELDYVYITKGRYYLTAKGESTGAEHVSKARFGGYFLWPGNFTFN
jgi:hypothetical protein